MPVDGGAASTRSTVAANPLVTAASTAWPGALKPVRRSNRLTAALALI
ncbi:hypothetical protein [Fodinicola feengrottensis]|nr:hypothetical protein [Fodinicola feengrottensis]